MAPIGDFANENLSPTPHVIPRSTPLQNMHELMGFSSRNLVNNTQAVSNSQKCSPRSPPKPTKLSRGDKSRNDNLCSSGPSSPDPIFKLQITKKEIYNSRQQMYSSRDAHNSLYSSSL